MSLLLVFLLLSCTALSVSEFLPPVIQPLALGALRPAGWLQAVLEVQLSGQTGSLPRFWPDVCQSTWLGGNANEEGGAHERLPYWLNGAVPLAFLLPDGPANATDAYSLRAEVARVVETILSDAEASPTGWLGGPLNPGSSTDGDQYWITIDAMLALLQYADAAPESAPRIATALARHAAEMGRRMRGVAPLSGWSSMRWPEIAAALQATADALANTMRTNLDKLGATADVLAYATRAAAAAAAAESADGSDDTPTILAAIDDIASTASLAEQQGFNWTAYYFTPGASPGFDDTVPTSSGWSQATHGVNHAMAIKAGAVAWRSRGGSGAPLLPAAQLARLDAAHAQPSGTVAADECLAGSDPARGSELCLIVELLWSVAFTHRVLGSVELADRAEVVAFNALPGGVSEDAKAHNYLSMPNQIFAGTHTHFVAGTDGKGASAYGLQPNFGCCTANHVQGWPKLAAYGLVGVAGDGSIALSVYAPLNATLPGGGRLSVDTKYPFEDVRIRVAGRSRPIVLRLRIPAWPGTPRVDGAAVARGGWRAVACAPPCEILLDTAPSLVVAPSHGGVVITRGPLVFALPLEEAWSTDRSYGSAASPFASDFTVTTRSAWNVALLLASNTSTFDGAGSHTLRLERATDDRGGSAFPFSAASPRLWLAAQARQVAGWASPDGGETAGRVPHSPACGGGGSGRDATGGSVCGPLRPVKLVPYGNTRLRMSVLPYTLE